MNKQVNGALQIEEPTTLEDALALKGTKFYRYWLEDDDGVLLDEWYQAVVNDVFPTSELLDDDGQPVQSDNRFHVKIVYPPHGVRPKS